MLGLAVKDLRDKAGLTQTALAKAILVSNSTISRLENAETTPERRTVEAVMNQLKLDSPARDELTMLLSRAEEPEWFQSRFGDFTAEYLRRLLGLESMAIVLTTYDVRLVSGLLQTPEYANCIIRTGLHISEWDSPEMAMRVALRRERQERVFGQADPPRCVFLMDESVLLRRVGPNEVMLEQMLHLLEIADLPHLTLRFVLLDRMIAGNEASMAGGMAHLQFGRGGLPDLVYVEGYGKADYYNKPARSAEERTKPWPTKDNEFERHLQLLLRIQGEACASPADSRRMLEAAVKRYS
ncbi:helix-turn-helix transcriptional regulator [Streptomyces sp. NBC_01142]|uniref:helix-turn-helix domain-containing protein n=1 Tax=Streptomyces sp. NBC_01142 TaxID=2975865 RepID=UPI00224D192F|nr:helix-turn-helix transcriptional regulator [Streptomyces sp. NBC_01142]MCX4818322.1 helix-turn-helix transcriptional regulator [Streptomyces sp. NBC_01142]MCX4824786.1 helix-turn-helix transcriptional regulator [Streptomyces sp. NBC_01142]MCX4826979.1 helix-turn-helix transcriptional regulator [Streptomyces sp. NBC_01142]